MKRKSLLIAILGILMILSLTACGKSGIVKIDDEGVVTEIEVKLPNTVEAILTEADITVGEDDEVIPSLDTKLSDAGDISIQRKKTIELIVDGNKKSIDVLGGTVSDVLEQEGITLNDKQKVNPDVNTKLSDGMQIKIAELFSVNFVYDGQTVTKDVEAATVEAALKEAGISLGPDDSIKPELAEPVTDGMEITVLRTKTETVTEKVAIEYETEYTYDDSIYEGYQEVITEGKNGEKEVTYKVTIVDGKEESREVVEEKVITEPTNEVIALGTYQAEVSTSSETTSNESSDGRTIVSQKAYYDCDGSGHGYYEIVYSDGTTEYVQF